MWGRIFVLGWTCGGMHLRIGGGVGGLGSVSGSGSGSVVGVLTDRSVVGGHVGGGGVKSGRIRGGGAWIRVAGTGSTKVVGGGGRRPRLCLWLTGHGRRREGGRIVAEVGRLIGVRVLLVGRRGRSGVGIHAGMVAR